MIKTCEQKMMEYAEGWEVTVRLDGTLQEYAIAFLHIFNNVKEHSELVRITNDYGNLVYVVCYADALDDTVEYLKQFGEVVAVHSALIVRCGYDIEYSYDMYDAIACDFQEL